MERGASTLLEHAAALRIRADHAQRTDIERGVTREVIGVDGFRVDGRVKRLQVDLLTGVGVYDDEAMVAASAAGDGRAGAHGEPPPSAYDLAGRAVLPCATIHESRHLASATRAGRIHMALNWNARSLIQDRMVIRAIDAHAAGEPLRVITEGLPALPGATILERRRYMGTHLDHI